MAGNRSLGSLVIDLILKMAGFEQGMDKAARTAADRARKIGKNLAVIGTAATAAAGAVTAAAVSWTKDVIHLGVELDKFAKISKSSTQEFQRWAVGAQSVGISQEKLSDQLKDFNEKVGEFRETGGGGMKDFFETIAPKIGITADAFKNLSGPQALQLYYNSLEKANLSQEQLSFYLESMASDTTALIPLLRNGGEGFRKWGDEADRLGSILDNETMEAIRGVREQTARLDQIMLGLKVTVAKELLPPFERFANLLGEEKTQDGLRTMADLLGKTAGAAVTFAEKIAQAGIAYRDFLADQGYLPADMLGNLDQLDERIRKLTEMQYGSGVLNDIRRGVFGDTIGEELRKAIQQRNILLKYPDGLPDFSNVTTGGAPAGGGGGGGGKPPGGKGRDLPDFAKEARDELREAMEAVIKARGEFDAWAAQLAGPVAAANYQFAVDMEKLNQLARDGEVSAADLTEAQAKLREEHEANVEALQAQLTPAEEALKYLQEETLWLQANEEGQRRLAAARMLGVDATEAQIDAAVELMETNERLAEQQRNWDELNRNISDSLFDIASGAESATDAIKNFLESLHQQILRNISNEWADSLTNFFKSFMNNNSWASQNGIGSAIQVGNTTTGGGGGFWANLWSSLWGGGFADGGYTGPGGKYQPAGVVHAGEFVMQADAVRKIGLPFLEALNGMKNVPGFARGGFVDAWATNERGSEMASLPGVPIGRPKLAIPSTRQKEYA